MFNIYNDLFILCIAQGVFNRIFYINYIALAIDPFLCPCNCLWDPVEKLLEPARRPPARRTEGEISQYRTASSR